MEKGFDPFDPSETGTTRVVRIHHFDSQIGTVGEAWSSMVVVGRSQRGCTKNKCFDPFHQSHVEWSCAAHRESHEGIVRPQHPARADIWCSPPAAGAVRSRLSPLRLLTTEC